MGTACRTHHMPSRTGCAALACTAAAVVVVAAAAALLLLCTALAPAAFAELEMLEHEMVAFVDANGIYTIAGNVKNHHPWAAAPELVITIRDGPLTHLVEIPYGAIPAGGELPFKAKVPGASGASAVASYEMRAVAHAGMQAAAQGVRDLSVLYDDTLIVHIGNGSMSGVAVNRGDSALYNPVMWAVIHGEDGRTLDVARSAPLGLVGPGQSVGFEMHPDPVVSGVAYYSCFAPSSDSVVPLYAKRGDQDYNMRYESGAWLYKPAFSPDGTAVTMRTTNSYPFETYANLEIPAVTRTESFDVLRNGEGIDHQQSIDEMGMWHLSFEIRGQSQDVIEIQGFEPGPLLPPLVPDHIKQGLLAWASGGAGEPAAYAAMAELADRDMLPPLPLSASDAAEGPRIPEWIKTVVVWWVMEGEVGDGEALAAIAYVVESGLVVFG